MTQALESTTLFLDSTKIGHISTTASGAAYPFVDFEFEEGDLRSVAILTVNVDEDSWHAVVRVAEDEDSDFDEGIDASADQVNALKTKLPENAQTLIDAFKAEHSPQPKF